jgi:crotonobetainyl-CoA:carnitine CoA-transferase CaiB-like acyl-CoA transferase
MVASPTEPSARRGPLTGLRVLEFGPIPAGTIGGSLLADFGAEVIRLSKPRGDDPLDAWWGGVYTKDRISLVHKVQDRNKLKATLDLSNPDNLPIIRKLIESSDAILSNFRPGRLEEWGLSPATLQSWNPSLIICLLSAFGQTGPYRDRTGDGRIAEAFGGHANLSGFPDREPLHSQMDMGGSLAGSWCAMALVFALYWRDARGGHGQIIDVAGYEPLYRQIQDQVMSYFRNGRAEIRAGNRKANGMPFVASHTTKDGRQFTYSAATHHSSADQLHAMGLQTDERFADVHAVDKHRLEYHAAASGWMADRTLDEVVTAFDAFEAAGTPVQTAADLIKDPHLLARDLVLTVDDPELGPVRMQGIVPKFSETPGELRHAGRAIDADNNHVFRSILGLSDAEYAEIRRQGVS